MDKELALVKSQMQEKDAQFSLYNTSMSQRTHERYQEIERHNATKSLLIEGAERVNAKFTEKKQFVGEVFELKADMEELYTRDYAR